MKEQQNSIQRNNRYNFLRCMYWEAGVRNVNTNLHIKHKSAHKRINISQIPRELMKKKKRSFKVRNGLQDMTYITYRKQTRSNGAP